MKVASSRYFHINTYQHADIWKQTIGPEVTIYYSSWIVAIWWYSALMIFFFSYANESGKQGQPFNHSTTYGHKNIINHTKMQLCQTTHPLDTTIWCRILNSKER